MISKRIKERNNEESNAGKIVPKSKITNNLRFRRNINIYRNIISALICGLDIDKIRLNCFAFIRQKTELITKY